MFSLKRNIRFTANQNDGGSYYWAVEVDIFENNKGQIGLIFRMDTSFWGGCTDDGHIGVYPIYNQAITDAQRQKCGQTHVSLSRPCPNECTLEQCYLGRVISKAKAERLGLLGDRPDLDKILDANILPEDIARIIRFGVCDWEQAEVEYYDYQS